MAMHISHSHSCYASHSTNCTRQQQEQLVYWRSCTPVHAMKQLERAVLATTAVQQVPRAFRHVGPGQGWTRGNPTSIRQDDVLYNIPIAPQQLRTSHLSSSQLQKQVINTAAATAGADDAVANSTTSVGCRSQNSHPMPSQLSDVMQLELSHHSRRQQYRSMRLSMLPELLAEHQARHLQLQPATGRQGAPAPGSVLDRKLTAIMTDSCSSWQDVAVVLLAADSTGRLNAVHIAAALARLARLAAADRAAAGSGAGAASMLTTSIVPVGMQQAQQLRHIRQAAAAATTAGFKSKWQFAVFDPATAKDVGTFGSLVDEQSVGSSSIAGEHLDHHEDQQQQLLHELCLAVAEWWPFMSPATMSSCCWSVASLGQLLPEALLPLVGQALLDMAGQLDPGGNSRSTRHSPVRQLVVMLWSLAKMSVEPYELQPHSISQPPPLQQQQQPQVSKPQPRQQAPQPAEETLVVTQVLEGLAPHFQQLSSQGLSMLWWALGSWGCCLSHAAATALLDVTAAAIQQQALTARGLAVTIWAVARLKLCPDAAWLAAWLAAMHTALPGANGHDCAVSIWALARLGVPPPGGWCAALCWRAAAQSRQLAAQELPVLLWGLAHLRFRPALQVAQQLLQRGLFLAHSGQLSPQGLALTLWSTASLGMQPKALWIDTVLAAAGDYLPLFRSVDCSGLLVALVKLQHIPHQLWMDVWWQETQGKLAAADGQQLVLLLWGAVQLGQAPPAAWLTEWQRCCIQAMERGKITAQGYGLIWHAILQLEVPPSTSWLSTYWQASIKTQVLQDLGCLTAERTLSGLAALAQLAPGTIRPPAEWLVAFLGSTEHILGSAKIVNLCTMLQAAGMLQILLPHKWLQSAMDRLGTLLQVEGVIMVDSNTSGNGTASSTEGSVSASRSRSSYQLSARLRRRWLAAWLKQALEGLRAQQMLARAAAGQRSQAGQQHTGTDKSTHTAAGDFDALAVWPWLSDAVLTTWPNKLSALQALKGLSAGYSR